MTLRSLAFVLSIILLASCKTQYEGTALNEEVKLALQQREDALKKTRTSLQFESGATAHTCDEYLRLVVSEPVTEDVVNQLAKSEYLICDVLALAVEQNLSNHQPAPQYGEALAGRLDLRSFSSSLHQMLDEKTFLLSQLGGNAVKTDATAARYDTQDWHFRLEWVATLDADKNGKADWVVWLTDEAKNGKYRHYQTLIIYDAGATGWLRAAPHVPKGRRIASAN